MSISETSIVSTKLYSSLALGELDLLDRPYVKAHISSISFPTSIEELETYVYEHGRYNVEDILAYEGYGWTVPRSSQIGDIVLFFHAMYADRKITALITQVRALPDNSGHDRILLLKWLEHARTLHKTYGGKIFAIGRIVSTPEYWDIPSDDGYHFSGRTYADICDITVLQNPISIENFRSFIKISRGSGITYLPSAEFRKLRNLIQKSNNALPTYFLKSEIGDFKLSQINSKNFLTITQMYRRRFLYEIDFRSYYVNYLLKAIAGKKVYSECACHSTRKPTSYVDNVFELAGKCILLEVKLNVHIERDLYSQLQQYVNADYICLTGDCSNRHYDFEREYMYVIDTKTLYLYRSSSNTLEPVILLDNITSAKDITSLL